MVERRSRDNTSCCSTAQHTACTGTAYHELSKVTIRKSPQSAAVQQERLRKEVIILLNCRKRCILANQQARVSASYHPLTEVPASLLAGLQRASQVGSWQRSLHGQNDSIDNASQLGHCEPILLKSLCVKATKESSLPHRPIRLLA